MTKRVDKLPIYKQKMLRLFMIFWDRA